MHIANFFKGWGCYILCNERPFLRFKITYLKSFRGSAPRPPLRNWSLYPSRALRRAFVYNDLTHIQIHADAMYCVEHRSAKFYLKIAVIFEVKNCWMSRASGGSAHPRTPAGARASGSHPHKASRWGLAVCALRTLISPGKSLYWPPANILIGQWPPVKTSCARHCVILYKAQKEHTEFWNFSNYTTTIKYKNSQKDKNK